jgi:hypothetical protein
MREVIDHVAVDAVNALMLIPASTVTDIDVLLSVVVTPEMIVTGVHPPSLAPDDAGNEAMPPFSGRTGMAGEL